MLLDREQRAGRYLEWKVRLFSLAAVTALVGMYLDVRWMVGLAIAILLAALLLRFLGDTSGDEGDGEDEED
jgi:hypothetical protein